MELPQVIIFLPSYFLKWKPEVKVKGISYKPDPDMLHLSVRDGQVRIHGAAGFCRRVDAVNPAFV